jgi:hypothetical protein
MITWIESCKQSDIDEVKKVFDTINKPHALWSSANTKLANDEPYIKQILATKKKVMLDVIQKLHEWMTKKETENDNDKCTPEIVVELKNGLYSIVGIDKEWINQVDQIK